MRLKPRIFRKPQLTHPLARGLVGYWLHNEGSGLITNDVSGNGSYGTITGATWAGDGLSFPSSGDKVDIPAIAITGPRTYLIKHKTISSTTWVIPFGSADSFVGWLNTGLIRYEDSNGFDASLSVTRPAVGSPLFWALSDDGTNYTFYNNGVSLGSAASPGGTFTFSELGDTFGGGFDYAGTMEMLMVYNRALLAEEILRLFRDPYILFRQDPLALWVAATSVGGVPPGTNPKGPLGHPLYGPFAGPIAC